MPKKSRHTEAQKQEALKQLESGRKTDDVAKELGISKPTLYSWKKSGKAKDSGMSQSHEVKQLRDENAKLRKMVIDLMLKHEN